MNNDNNIVCPVCGKIHTIINKNGELRQDIHCRCKTKNWHTHIFWVTGAGYYYNDENFNLVSC